MRSLVSKVWWEAAGVRAARTALVVAIPYIPASYTGQVPYLTILSAAILAAILSLLTSLISLPELNDRLQPWWFSVIERVVKTVAQAALTGVGNALLLQNVHWLDIAQVSLAAGFGSLLLAFLSDLPEAPAPVAVATVAAVSPSADPGAGIQAVPIVATIPATEAVDAAPVLADPIPDPVPPVAVADPVTPAAAKVAPVAASALPTAVPVVPSDPATKENLNDKPLA